jgi:hypothetical protein
MMRVKQEGGTMQAKAILTCIFLSLSFAQVVAADAAQAADYGMLPVVEVVAHRYSDELPVYVGAMPEVTVTASRYDNEDVAWSGLMPGITVTALSPDTRGLVYVKKQPKDLSQDYEIIAVK